MVSAIGVKGDEVNLPQFNGHFKSEAESSQKEYPNEQD